MLESFDTDVVPTTVAITAGEEPMAPRGPAPAGQAQPASAIAGGRPGQFATATPKAGGRGDAPLPETKPIVWAGKTKVLVIGGGSCTISGGSSAATDIATLDAAGYTVNYTEDRDQAASEIGKADVAVISVNRQFFDTPANRKALFDFAAAGKGVVMLHRARGTVSPMAGAECGHRRGRVARSRPDRKFSVNAVKPDHPVMKGVPESFEVEDELYY